MVPAACRPGVVTRAPAKAWIIRSRHGPQSGEVVVEMAAGMAFGTAKCWHTQIPSSSVAASPSRRQIDPPSAGGKNRIA